MSSEWNGKRERDESLLAPPITICVSHALEFTQLFGGIGAYTATLERYGSRSLNYFFWRIQCRAALHSRYTQLPFI